MFQNRTVPLAAAILAAWAVFLSACLFYSGFPPPLATDDAMRLVQVRDLLAGQGWSDLVQHRLNAPYGLLMHWTRVIDAGLAALILFFRIFTDHARAETLALAVWPMLAAVPLFAGVARLALVLSGRAAAFVALFLVLTAVPLLQLFAPGAIDHHNIQIALTLWLLVALAERRGIVAGVLAAASLAIGVETLPYVLAASVTVAVLWVIDGVPAARFAQRFGVGLAAASVFFQFATTASVYRFTPACDTYSLFYVVAAVVGGAGLALLTGLPYRNAWQSRVAVMALLALIVLGIDWSLNPRCLLGPYGAIDPRLNDVWLSRVYEARPAWDFARLAPSEFFAGYGYGLFGLLAAIWLAWRAPARRDLCIALAFLAAAMLCATLQARAMPYAIALAIAPLALAVTAPRLRLVARVLLGVAACNVTFVVIGATVIQKPQDVTARANRFAAETACASPDAMALLPAAPRATIASFVDQGPAIIAFTPHAALAGPYHRGAAGILDTDTIFAGHAADARAIVARRGVTHVMFCTASNDWSYYLGHAAPDSIIRAIVDGHAPSWLIPAGTALRGTVRLYRVR